MNITIMLADDDPDDVMIFKDLINEIFRESAWAYQLYTVANGAELMDVLSKGPVMPNLLFLDINMPRKNGFVCLSEIREDKRFSNIKVIMLSTSSFHGHVRSSYERGADLYIVKSPDYSKLKEDIMTGIQMQGHLTFGTC